MEVLSIKEIQKVVLNVDSYNDDSLDTFANSLTDYCEEITATDLDEIYLFLESDLQIDTDAELKQLTDDGLSDLCDYINNLIN